MWMQEIGCFTIHEGVNFRVQNLSFQTNDHNEKWKAEFLFFTLPKAKSIVFLVFF